MTGDQPEYLAYLLRLWRTHHGGRWVWRASLESPHTAERQVFAGLEGLYAFLEEKTGSCVYREPSKNGD
jgi:hypothetical protein